jgi:hypothetical protein
VTTISAVLTIAVLAVEGLSPTRAAAQQPSPVPVQPAAAAPSPATTGRLTPLKVQLVITRTQGDKKVSSLPYVLWVTANDRQETNLRMGVEVPVSMGTSNSAIPSYSYRPIGTNIDCRATTVDNSFNLSITLSDSSIQFDPKEAVPTSNRVTDAPAFRSFTSKFSILLRDGQTAQYSSATDPVSGETLKVDVTLNVLK